MNEEIAKVLGHTGDWEHDLNEASKLPIEDEMSWSLIIYPGEVTARLFKHNDLLVTAHGTTEAEARCKAWLGWKND